MGRGWGSVPKNKSDAKMKIIKSLISMRKQNDAGNEYELDQSFYLATLQRMWGESRPCMQLQHNDRVRVYGLVMAKEDNREIYQRLAEGVTSRRSLDDPALSLKQMFQNIAVEFNNDDIMVELPADAFDMDCIVDINPNDYSRMRITRDCKFIIIFILYIIYFC